MGESVGSGKELSELHIQRVSYYPGAGVTVHRYLGVDELFDTSRVVSNLEWQYKWSNKNKYNR